MIPVPPQMEGRETSYEDVRRERQPSLLGVPEPSIGERSPHALAIKSIRFAAKDQGANCFFEQPEEIVGSLVDQARLWTSLWNANAIS